MFCEMSYIQLPRGKTKNEKNGKLKLTNFSRKHDVSVLLPQFEHVVHTFDTNFSQDFRT